MLAVGLLVLVAAPNNALACHKGDPAIPHGAQTTCDGAAPTTRLVFLTSTTYNGALEPRPAVCDGPSGVLAGDCICQNHADLAGLPGVFMAWLSTDDTDSPFANFTQSAVPYVRLDGARVAANWNDLIDKTLISPIYVDESGGRPSTASGSGDTLAWTGTEPNGTANLNHDCNGWSSMSGADTGLRGCSANPMQETVTSQMRFRRATEALAA